MAEVDSIVDVLVIGAGPTGLTAAAEAKRLGLTVRILDRKKDRSTHDSRALIVHPRVMELLHGMGNGRVCKGILEEGSKVENVNIYVEGSTKPVSRPHIGSDAKWGDSVYPFIAYLPQYRTETVLQKELETTGGNVEWNTSLSSLTQNEQTVETTVTMPDGSDEIIVSRYVVGCDGGQSKTRELLGIEMNRQKSSIYMIVADIKCNKESWPFDDTLEPRLFLHSEGPTAMFPLDKTFLCRVLTFAPEGVTKDSDIALDKAFFDTYLPRRTGFSFNCTVGDWATVFEITHGMASKFRERRVFLAGDASHVHSPVGGQGMNYGISDAVNLMWKLAWAERCRRRLGYEAALSDAMEPILESYSDEREELGRGLIGFVERATNVIASRNFVMVTLRNLFARFFIPLLMPRNARDIGQLNLGYSAKHSRIICDSQSKSFICVSGDRLPNLHLANGDRLHDKVGRKRHTWVVLNPNTQANAEASSLGPGGVPSVHTAVSSVQDSHPHISDSAMKVPQAILVRPDLHVAAIGETVDDVWDRMGKIIERDALLSM